jgi:hypothetical protein
VITGFQETPGWFIYVAINYQAGSGITVKVGDSQGELFSPLPSVSQSTETVAFWYLTSAYGNTVTITVTLGTAEYGNCAVGMLTPGTVVGLVGTGATGTDSASLQASNAAPNQPSLLLALFAATAPTGSATISTTAGSSWLEESVGAGYRGGGVYDGSNQYLEADQTETGVTFDWVTGNGQTPDSAGLVVEFYLGAVPISDCFGGGICSGPSGGSAGYGTTCIIYDYSEPAGDFMYVAINYQGSTNVISSVADGSVDQFTPVETGSAGPGSVSSSDAQFVAFWDVPSTAGKEVTITVTLSTAEFGSCTVGLLSANSIVGSLHAIGVVDGYSWSYSNAAAHEPSLVLAFIGATRPTGTTTESVSGGTNWELENLATGSSNDGANQYLYGDDYSQSGALTFTWTSSYSSTIAGLTVEIYTEYETLCINQPTVSPTFTTITGASTSGSGANEEGGTGTLTNNGCSVEDEQYLGSSTAGVSCFVVCSPTQTIGAAQQTYTWIGGTPDFTYSGTTGANVPVYETVFLSGFSSFIDLNCMGNTGSLSGNVYLEYTVSIVSVATGNTVASTTGTIAPSEFTYSQTCNSQGGAPPVGTSPYVTATYNLGFSGTTAFTNGQQYYINAGVGCVSDTSDNQAGVSSQSAAGCMADGNGELDLVSASYEV